MYSLNASVQGYYESLDSITFYTISVTHSPSGQSWIINRKLEEFHSLYKILCDNFRDVPVPPCYKTFSYLSSYFTSIVPGLNDFLNQVFEIPSVFSSEVIYTFFDVGLHAYKFKSIKVSLEAKYDTRYIVQKLLNCEEFIISVEVDYATLHRLEQYLQTIGYSGSVMSRVRIFYDSKISEYRTVQIITSISYNHDHKVLILGCENGNIELLRLTSVTGSFIFEEIRVFKAHYRAVKGVITEEDRVFSCDIDGRLIIISIDDENLLIDITLSFIPKSMAISQDTNYLFFCSEKQFHIFDVNSYQCLKNVDADLDDRISAFAVTQQGFIIVGGFNGKIIVYNNLCEIIQRFSIAAAVSCISYDEKNMNIYASDQNGIVTIWNSSGDTIFKWKTHDSANCVQVCQSLCVTAGNDLTIRFWNLAGLDTTKS